MLAEVAVAVAMNFWHEDFDGLPDQLAGCEAEQLLILSTAPGLIDMDGTGEVIPVIQGQKAPNLDIYCSKPSIRILPYTYIRTCLLALPVVSKLHSLLLQGTRTGRLRSDRTRNQ